MEASLAQLPTGEKMEAQKNSTILEVAQGLGQIMEQKFPGFVADDHMEEICRQVKRLADIDASKSVRWIKTFFGYSAVINGSICEIYDDTWSLDIEGEWAEGFETLEDAKFRAFQIANSREGARR